MFSIHIYVCIYTRTILVFILKNTVTSLGINMEKGEREYKCSYPLTPVISLLGMQLKKYIQQRK